MNKLSISSFILIIIVATLFSNTYAQPLSRKTKKATVYTTAKDSKLRLNQTGTYSFEQGRQPLETELSIFVNPDVSFQTFVGIGGAITDASAA